MNDLYSAVDNEISDIIKSLTKDENIARIFHEAKALMDKHGEERAKRIPHDLVQYFYESIESATPTERCIRAFMCSAAFAIQSQRSLKSGDNPEALYCFKLASLFFGRAIGSIINHPEAKEVKRVIDGMAKLIQEGGSKGGKKKDSKREPIIKIAVELLSKRMPKGGWNSKSEAAKCIVNEFNKLVKKYILENPEVQLHIGKSEYSRFELIQSWMRNRAEVKRAFIDHASQPAINRLKKSKIKEP